MRDFPQMLYRADGAIIASRLVTDDATLATAAAEGWGDRAEAKRQAERGGQPARAAPAKVAAIISGADPAELAKVKEALAASQEAAESAREYAKALGDRVDTLESFLRTLASDEGAPEPLRADITALLGGVGIGHQGGEEPASPARRPKAKK